jgi:hypothetical protein
MVKSLDKWMNFVNMFLVYNDIFCLKLDEIIARISDA